MPCDYHSVKGTIQLSKTCSAVINSCSLTHEHLQSIWQSSLECHVLTYNYCACVRACVRVCVCARICVCTCVRACVCHMYIHTYILSLVGVVLQSGEV